MRYSLLPDATLLSYHALPHSAGTRGVGDWTDVFGDFLAAGTTIGTTVLTGHAPGTVATTTPPAGTPAQSTNTWKWIGIVGLGGLLLFMVMKRRRRG